MPRSQVSTVEAYLAGLPPERREVVASLRKFVRQHLPTGYIESMCWGMPSYCIPLKRYPDTYNGQPLGYVALAAQKNNYSLYLMGCHMCAEQTQQLRDAFDAAGKKLDMGKSCVRFRKLDDLPLPAIGKLIASMSVKDYIARYEQVRGK